MKGMGLLRMMRFYRDHRWTRRHLSEYVDGELGAHERERVEHHVHLCPDCWRLLATLKRTLAGLMGLREDASSEIADSVITRLRAEP
jgi:anti-sigma factor RsiW